MVEGMADSGWQTSLSRGLYEAWKTKLFTDLVITTHDDVIHAHKLVLAAASPYFRAMMSVGLVEGQTQTLVLEDVSGAVLNTVLNFVYTGQVTLTEHNVQEVLILADYFQIYSLKNLCCYFLKNDLVMRTCLSVYELATLHRCHDLAADAMALACSQCSELLTHPSFLTIQPQTLLDLLKQPYLSVETEEELFKGVIRWASHDPEERRKWLPAFVQKIDLGFLDSQEKLKWLASMEESSLLSEDLRCILTPLELNSDGTDDGSDDQEESTTKLRHNSQDEVLLVMGGESNGRLLRNIECFAIGYSSWRCSIPDLDAPLSNRNYSQMRVLPTMEHARAYCSIATHENCVYVLGGQTNNAFLASCECFKVLTNSWSRLCDLPVPVHGAGSAFLEGFLYFAGGKSSEKYQHELLVYNEHQESWASRGSLSVGRAHFGLAALHGSLYAVGGMGCVADRSQVLASCERYDPGSDSWIPIAPLAQARAYLGVAVVHDHLYAIGGYDGLRWLSSVERYDPLRDQWTSVSSMVSARSSFGVTVSHGRIYCLGGFSGESNLNTVEKYNPRTDMWHCVQSMQLRRYGLVAATVYVPGTT